MYSAYMLIKQGGNIHHWRTPFPILNQFIVPCPVLTVVSWPAYILLRRQVRWSGIPISLRMVRVCCDPHSQRFGIVNEAEVDVFLELSCFFYHPMDVGNSISHAFAFLNPAWASGSSCFTYCWILTWRILSITSMWNECNCMVVWTFFGLALLWVWNENWPFPVLWPLLSFPNLLAYWVQHFNSMIF